MDYEVTNVCIQEICVANIRDTCTFVSRSQFQEGLEDHGEGREEH